MNIKKYNKGLNKKLSKSFKVKEFDCNCKRFKCNKTLIDLDILPLLEDMKQIIGAKSCIINSGFRCVEHNKEVGGSSNSGHLYGLGFDVVFKKLLKKIDSKYVCMLLELMQFNHGVGLYSGKIQYETHIDNKNRKYYFREDSKPYKRVKSFYINDYIYELPILPKRGYFSYTTRLTDMGIEVKKLQVFLNWYYHTTKELLKVDGIYGKNTREKILRFQGDNNLRKDGLCGKQTLKKIKEIINE